ncbi:NlpC/P60 family protein [uncultured Arcobacter sp.]|uniref:NlpC/P60 family protein n=1 Tax=uncultured Arcobacter sp. TaxID=165434 RepID=UPI0026398312|nr:NlpC/P60 family protein [uncultured Arcobacter sp.]
MKTTIFFTLFIILLLTGCSTRNPYTPTKPLSSYKTNDTYKNINISDALLFHYKQWQGVGYKYGGENRDGIDCSYFVYDAFRKTLTKQIPRTTLYQSKTGQSIQKKDLTTGDLVFFITSKKGSRHVGIYLKDGDFMHVSTSRGVMISSLSNPYWRTHYWKARRILSSN